MLKRSKHTNIHNSSPQGLTQPCHRDETKKQLFPTRSESFLKWTHLNQFMGFSQLLNLMTLKGRWKFLILFIKVVRCVNRIKNWNFVRNSWWKNHSTSHKTQELPTQTYKPSLNEISLHALDSSVLKINQAIASLFQIGFNCRRILFNGFSVFKERSEKWKSLEGLQRMTRGEKTIKSAVKSKSVNGKIV